MIKVLVAAGTTQPGFRVGLLGQQDQYITAGHNLRLRESEVTHILIFRKEGCFEKVEPDLPTKKNDTM